MAEDTATPLKPMDSRLLKQALHAGRRVYGTLIVSPSPHWPAAVKATGADFVFLDTEHIALDRAQLAWMCVAYRALSLNPIVRIPSPDPYLATMALDGGACGILAPYIESAAQVRNLVGAVKLRPVKGELLRNRLEQQESFPGCTEDYVRKTNAENLLLINIESVPAIEALDEILAIPGIDAVQVGPHDLSCSLGVPEDYDHPRFLAAICEIIRKCRAAKVGVGIHFWQSLEREVEWAKLGANLIVHSGDITLFAKKLGDDLVQMRSALGDEGSPVSEEQIVV